MTRVAAVTGDIDVNELGSTLMHEHVFILTPELDSDYPEIVDWNESEKFHDGVERLKKAKASGVDTIVDLTVVGMGRYVPRVKAMAEAADITIIVASGVYTFNELPHFLKLVGPGALIDAEEPMTEMFIKDVTTGIGDTGIKASIFKCATDHEGVTPGVERVLRAVAQAHRETGAPISTHTHAETKRGLDQLAIFEAEGVDLSRVIIGHSGDSTDLDYLRGMADRGAILGMDRFGMDTGEYSDFNTRVRIVAEMAKAGYAGQMVLSHDASCWMDWVPRERSAGTSADMPNWHFSHIHDEVVPALIEAGVTPEQVEQMLVGNPREIFSRPRTAY